MRRFFCIPTFSISFIDRSFGLPTAGIAEIMVVYALRMGVSISTKAIQTL